MTKKAAFLSGVQCFCKRAGMDADDAEQMERLLLMPVDEASPIVKEARLAIGRVNYLRAGTALVKTADAVADALASFKQQNFSPEDHARYVKGLTGAVDGADASGYAGADAIASGGGGNWWDTASRAVNHATNPIQRTGGSASVVTAPQSATAAAARAAGNKRNAAAGAGGGGSLLGNVGRTVNYATNPIQFAKGIASAVTAPQSAAARWWGNVPRAVNYITSPIQLTKGIASAVTAQQSAAADYKRRYGVGDAEAAAARAKENKKLDKLYGAGKKQPYDPAADKQLQAYTKEWEASPYRNHMTVHDYIGQRKRWDASSQKTPMNTYIGTRSFAEDFAQKQRESREGLRGTGLRMGPGELAKLTDAGMRAKSVNEHGAFDPRAYDALKHAQSLAAWRESWQGGQSARIGGGLSTGPATAGAATPPVEAAQPAAGAATPPVEAAQPAAGAATPPVEAAQPAASAWMPGASIEEMTAAVAPAQPTAGAGQGSNTPTPAVAAAPPPRPNRFGVPIAQNSPWRTARRPGESPTSQASRANANINRLRDLGYHPGQKVAPEHAAGYKPPVPQPTAAQPSAGASARTAAAGAVRPTPSPAPTAGTRSTMRGSYVGGPTTTGGGTWGEDGTFKPDARV